MGCEKLWPGGPSFRQSEHFRLCTDSVLLADFITPGGARRGIDLGCGAGILTLLLAEKSEKLSMTGLELQAEAAEIAAANLRDNALDGRCRVICGDLRRHRELFPAGSFELVVANPPYFSTARGAMAPVEARAAARAEGACTLEELACAASWLCRSGGSLFLVYRTERMSELFGCLSAHGLEPKRLRLVSYRAEDAPKLLLLEAHRDGRPGLRMEPPLILSDGQGGESTEYRRIYHR